MWKREERIPRTQLAVPVSLPSLDALQPKDSIVVLYLYQGRSAKSIDTKVFGPATGSAIATFVEQVHSASRHFGSERLGVAFGAGKYGQLHESHRVRLESIPADVRAMWQSWCSQFPPVGS